MDIKRILLTGLTCAALAFSTGAAEARGTTNQTKATVVGAAVGAVAGNLVGRDTKSTVIGAAVGGLAGNAYAYNNKRNTELDRQRQANKRRHSWSNQRSSWRGNRRHHAHR